MLGFNANLGSICRHALQNQQIYWKVERDFQKAIAQTKHCCRNCRYFDNNPYLACAVDPLQAGMPDQDNTCRFFDPEMRN